MKQDIRTLFEKEEEKLTHQLPSNHREEFLTKLSRHIKKEPKSNTKLWLRIAAIFIIGFAISFPFYKKTDTDSTTAIIAEVNAIETEYLKNIETEWQNFIRLTDDKNLINRFEIKLQELNTDYQDISKEYKADPQNILVVEALIDNLQTRLQLLKNIQEHINLLNQKNEQDEYKI